MAQLLPLLLLALGRRCWAVVPPVVRLSDTSELHVCSSTVIRVTHRPTSAPVEKRSLVAKSDWAPVDYNVSEDKGGDLVLETEKLRVLADSTDTVSFYDRATGRLLLQEAGAVFKEVQDMGRKSYEVEQSWKGGQDEAFYGGGSHQNGLLNYKSAPLQMIQFNTEAMVPFFTSTAGYGLLWDNYAWTYLNPAEKALVQEGAAGSGSVTFVPEAKGDHFFFVGKAFPQPGSKPTWGAGVRGKISVVLREEGGEKVTVLDWAENPNTPLSMTGRAPGLRKGVQYTVIYDWNLPGAGLFVRGPESERTTLRSALGNLVDYYFLFGETPGAVTAGYREVTGAAPLLGKWAYGFWQCKEHYDTKQHLLEAAREFRSRGLPVDAIVQDWLYWGDLGWGPHWDPKVYPEPAQMVQQLHDMHMHLMVSVWSKFDEKTSFYKEMKERSWTLGTSNFYDAYNPRARELFYNFSKTAHFDIGVDSLWLDASEPENYPNVGSETYLGSGDAFMNTYSLMTTQAIADGLRKDFAEAQGARVFSLTRSSFAGQQRNGAAYWTGDTTASWDNLRRQIAASINFQLSGMPYWSQDIGGFFRPKGQYESSEYQELLVRWFQFGALTPIFRVHGAGSNTELWNYREETMRAINTSALALRYRLLPYTYSGYARVEKEGYTMQRALAMDFPADREAWSVADEFMWGDALLSTPLHTPAAAAAAASRAAYLPTAAAWVNFQTGAPQEAGHVQVSFPLDEAPLFVRAGSLLVLGPLRQHAADGREDPLEVRVYPGADASFRLFEDDGVSQAYKQGQAATVDFAWNDSRSELTIGARQGSFPGMPQLRTLHVVRVSHGHGAGVAPVDVPDKVARYDGKAVVVDLGPAPVPGSPTYI